MKNTPDNIFTLSRETALSLADSSWLKFLQTAAWNYKYDFISQLLIFAQKPEATACASYEIWTSDAFQRMPRKGTGIALLNDHGDRLGLQYVFDISDTFVKTGATPPPPIWEGTREKESSIRQALAKEYLPPEQQTDAHLGTDPETYYRSVASSIVQERTRDSESELTSIRSNCALGDLSPSESARIWRSLLAESLSAIIQYRCGLDPQVDETILDNVRLFDNEDAISLLGTTTQHLSRHVLPKVAHAVRQWDNKHKEEVTHENHISAGRGASDPEPDYTAATEAEQIRADAQSISEKPQAKPVQQSAAEGRVEPSSGRDGGEGQGSSGEHHAASGQHDPSAPVQRHTGHDEVPEQFASDGRGAGLSGDSLRVTLADLDRGILSGPPLEGGKFRLYAAATDISKSDDQLADILRKEYGTGSRAFMLTSGITGKLIWGFSGLSVERREPLEGDSMTLPWKAVSERLRGLTEANSYLDEAEKHQAELYFASQEALHERQEIGETLRVFLSIYDKGRNREAISQSQENIRAYVYENSNIARQSLLGKLLELSIRKELQNGPDASDALQDLIGALEEQTDDEHTLPSATDAGIPPPFPLDLNEAKIPGREENHQAVDLPASVNEVQQGMILKLTHATYLVSEISETQVILEDINTPLYSPKPWTRKPWMPS